MIEQTISDMPREFPSSHQCAKWLKALGEPIRLEIVRFLSRGPSTVTAITEALGIEIANVSHHLQVLLHADLVEVEKEGRFSIYRLNAEFVSKQSRQRGNTFDFGCCRFELPESPLESR
jgi:DNA-binding transcriptional ArsR family regulator